MPKLTVGKKAPAFEIALDSGETFRLADHAGRPVVLYFYPQDDTEGCTIENIEFTGLMPEFKAAGAVVIGISPDSVDSHCRFRDKYSLGVPLGADPEQKVLKAYGLWGPKVTFGHHLIGVLRTSVVIDARGKIAAILPARRIKGHAAKVLEATRALATE